MVPSSIESGEPMTNGRFITFLFFDYKDNALKDNELSSYKWSNNKIVKILFMYTTKGQFIDFDAGNL